VPTGIATDATTQHFFADLMERRQLASLYDFENRKKLFPAIDSRMKFCLLTLTGPERPAKAAEFAFFCHETRDLQDPERRFTLSPEDLRLVNPNTRTAPIFRSRRDAELTKHIYRRVPVLVDETRGRAGNPWGVAFLRMFDMSNDSHLFRTRAELAGAGFRLVGNVFVRGKERYLPLYEAKMVHQFDHRFGDYGTSRRIRRTPSSPRCRWSAWPTRTTRSCPATGCPRRRWKRACRQRLGPRLAPRLAGHHQRHQRAHRHRRRDPKGGGGEQVPPYASRHPSPENHALLTAVLDSFPLDYARGRRSAARPDYFTMKQLPVLPPAVFDRPARGRQRAGSRG
jgi:hypothetical protein